MDKTRHTGSLAGIISLDLTKLEDQQLVEWLDSPAVKAVFLAPPCGTASAARSIELPGENAPRPLRSFEEPDGLSTLHGLDLLESECCEHFVCLYCRNCGEMLFAKHFGYGGKIHGTVYFGLLQLGWR